MAAPAIDTSKILIGYGYLFTAVADTVEPDDTVIYGGDPGTDWTYIGATEEGVTYGFEREVNDHFVEEQSSAVLTTPGNGALSFSAALAEVTIENLKLALGGGTITTIAAAAGVVGKKVLTLSDQYDSFALCFYGKNPLGHYRRIYVPRARSVATLEVANRRNESKQLFNVTFNSNSALADIKITDKTADAAA